jgi:hypothetical protein
MTPRTHPLSHAAVAALALWAAVPAPAWSQTADAVTRLAARVEAQQRELDALRAELAALRAEQGVSTADQAVPPVGAAVAAEPPPPNGFVLFSREGGPTVTLTGQINQAVNLVDDGDDADFYFVDNDVSGTRFAIEATAPVGETTLGGLLEIGVSPNNSYSVSQESETADDAFTVRRADISARHPRYGRLALGRGSMALDDVAEYDLSLVAGSIMYAGVADPVGGMLFTDADGLTETAVGDAFFDFDGDRRSRIRYDTPVVRGLQASAAIGSENTWDVAATLGGDYGDWTGVPLGPVTALAAVGVGDPGVEGVKLRYAASLSLLHETGLGVTLSGGGEDRDDGDAPYSLYGKLSYDTEFFAFGPTGFGLDVSYAANVADDGDEGQSIGFAALQRIDPANLDLYGQIRWFTLDREGADLDDILAVTLGARFFF